MKIINVIILKMERQSTSLGLLRNGRMTTAMVFPAGVGYLASGLLEKHAGINYEQAVELVKYSAVLNEKELNRQIDQQKGYYHALTEQVLSEREARHYFRHQVAAIKGFLDKNDMEGLRGYCDDLELEEMGKVTIPYTGNAAADGVLYHYGCIARAKNIEFSVCCYLKDIAIPDTDFCTILGNALDNAVTAAGQYDGKRFIEVATEKKHDMLLITVDNSFDGILFQENGKIYSKKRQNKQEGIGILSMKKLCEKHGGASRFEAVGNRFQASFILKNEVED